jgi:hypothetical protein
VGLGYITVGRVDEIDALLHDVETIISGGATFRFVVGRYGAGKSFLLQAIRNYAMDRGFVVADCDLSPERRLCGNKGEGLATYRELMKNLGTKTSPDGGALPLLLQRWLNALRVEAMEERGLSADDAGLDRWVELKIQKTILELQANVHGFDFAQVITIYWKAARDGDDERLGNALRWLRGEYGTKSEAKRELGVGAVIGDGDWYEYVKLFSLFVVKAGYRGMLMLVDELVNIYKIPHSISRQYNYEKILSIYNDVMQGKARHLGVIMSGTPQCVEDARRGVFSYEALKSRLESSRFVDGDTRDLLSPIIRLKPLEPTEIYVLLEKLEQIHGQVYGYAPALSPEELTVFIEREYVRVGADQNITPREIIRDFIQVLDILLQNPGKTMQSILGGSFEFSKSMAAGGDIFSGFEI